MIKATFTITDLEGYIKQRLERVQQAVLNAYNLAGLEFVKSARIKTKAEGGFGDITGNLRSSIGYIVMLNGKQMFADFTEADFGTERAPGTLQGSIFANEIADGYPRGIVLVCVAGMQYAAAVESKGYDVITGSTLELETRLKQLLSEI